MLALQALSNDKCVTYGECGNNKKLAHHLVAKLAHHFVAKLAHHFVAKLAYAHTYISTRLMLRLSLKATIPCT